ncbi:MAG: carbohydrate porin [Phycisphaerales bacterium]
MRYKRTVLICLIVLTNSAAYAVWPLEDVNSFRSRLADDGIEFGASTTHIIQSNVKGGLSTHAKRGRYTGRYDIEFIFDGQKILNLENSMFYTHLRGSWHDEGGIDPYAVGSYFGVNANAYGNRAGDIVEAWYQQGFADNKFIVRIGKIDLTGGFECKGCPVSFDSSMYANDETTQFMNGALVNNPTIPFPWEGLAVVAFYNPVEWWYISAGLADAQADFRETGFQTAFHDEDYFFAIAETGFVTEFDSARGPLTGAYRFGIWYDPQPKTNTDDTDDVEKLYRDDKGFYLSFDQMLYRENEEDEQGLGTFFRYGYAPSKTNDLTNFVSAGLQYQGLFKGRDNDVLGFGFARGFFSELSKETYPQDSETVYELYYNAQLTENLSVTPSIQYVTHPGGQGTPNATILGLRVHLTL